MPVLLPGSAGPGRAAGAAAALLGLSVSFQTRGPAPGVSGWPRRPQAPRCGWEGVGQLWRPGRKGRSSEHPVGVMEVFLVLHFPPQTKLTATSALLSSRFLHFSSSPDLARGGSPSQALGAHSPPRRATPSVRLKPPCEVSPAVLPSTFAVGNCGGIGRWAVSPASTTPVCGGHPERGRLCSVALPAPSLEPCSSGTQGSKPPIPVGPWGAAGQQLEAPRQCRSPSVSRAAVAAWGLAVWGSGSVPYPGPNVTYGSFWALETSAEHKDPSLNAKRRSILPPGSGYLAKSPSYCIWRRKNLSGFLPKPSIRDGTLADCSRRLGLPRPSREALGSLSDKPVHLEWGLQGL